ncbi:unnamed protein product [Penicillium salamii]|nr:unnamed protein product [Penicillium salamii]
MLKSYQSTDGPNGARGESYTSGIKAACFPCATNLGATFDRELLYKIGKECAKEAKTKAANVLLAPTLNVIRSPLGGRNYETYSEDPVLLGNLASEYVKGCQAEGVAATPKHFVANEAENQRKTLTVDIDEQTLREIYLLPFQLVVKKANPLCLMTSYNRVNGTYVSDDKRLLDDVLRREWGFDGLVMSDWLGTYSTAPSVNAGVDLEMPGPTKWRGSLLLEAIQKGEVTKEAINASARRVLVLAKKLGRFENPGEAKEISLEDPVRDAFIRDAAAEGMVLLKNEKDLLPLPAPCQNLKIAMIGQFAGVAALGGGGSAKVDSIRAISPVEGMESAGYDVRFHEGVPVFKVIPHAPAKMILETAKVSDNSHTNAVKMEWYNGNTVGRNNALTEMIQTPEYMIKEQWPSYLDQDYCSRMTFDIKPSHSGLHHFSVITTGQAKCYINGQLVYEREQETDLILEAFYFYKEKLERRFDYEMEAGRRYTVILESWATDPDILHAKPLYGKMFQGSSIRFAEHIDYEARIEAAVNVAREAAIAVVCVGNTNEIESEGFDRETMGLLGYQNALVKAVAAGNPKTVVVNFSGGPIDLTPILGSTQAFLQAWLPGQECGHSVARVLTGQINPCGQLPFSWPACIEDNPSYGNFPADDKGVLRYEEKLNVGYRFYDRPDTPSPLFPFGYGLSYTSFAVSNPQIISDKSLDGPNETVEVTAEVRNGGLKDGKVAVQFYVAIPGPESAAGHGRPIKELKNFAKLFLRAQETQTITGVLDKYSVSYYDAGSACWRAESGRYTVYVGLSAAEATATATFEVTRPFEWTGV